MTDNSSGKKILILSNHFITLYAFRRELIERLTADGNDVYISIPEDERNEYFEKLGCRLIITPMSRRGMNPLKDFGLLRSYRRIMRDLRPDIVFSYTIKPNIYGAMAANSLKLKQVCNITGTGATFMKEGLLSAAVRTLYRMSLRNVYKVFFQNTGDRDYFVKHGLVRDNWDVLPGSGVNLKQHCFTELPADDTVSFIYIGRIMAVKGIREFLNCAEYIRPKYPNARFYMAGFIEEERLEASIREAAERGIVEYVGFQEDIDSWIRKCHCTILPSLGGEGVPNVLLESAATGRACIASRINGSMDVVEEGRTGFLFEPGNTDELIEKVEKFLALSFEEKRAMGCAGHEKVEREFDREIVISRYMREV